MIGSHDTFTYLAPTCKLYNHFIRLWRTQCKTIKQQYEWGVRFFDLRVCKHKNRWYFAHGKATLSMSFDSVIAMCYYMEKTFPLAVYRVVLEKGGSDDEREFKTQIHNFNTLHPSNHLWLADIRREKYWKGGVWNNSLALYSQGFTFTRNSCTWTEPNLELHGKVDVHNILKVNLKTEAKKINENLGMNDLTKLQEMYEDPTRLYLLDYCTNEY